MRRLARGSVLLWAAGLGACSPSVPPREDAVSTTVAIREASPPPLAWTHSYEDPSSALGYGTLDLSARPMQHEIRVDMMVGAPMRAPRWRYCGAGALSIDARHKILPLRWSGVPMGSGLYDAVTVDITIEDVRAMSRAESVTVDVCGDR